MIDFIAIDAPLDCPEEPPKELKRFLSYSGRTNFRQWVKFPDQEPHLNLPSDSVFGLEETVAYLVDILKVQGPFDGVMCFSQGGIIFRHFHRITQEIDRQSFQHPVDSSKQVFEMPKFMITVASPVFDMQFHYKGEYYRQRMTPQFNFPSIHLHGTEDKFSNQLNIHELFEEQANAQVVEYDAGHRFPRKLTDDGFNKLKHFVQT